MRWSALLAVVLCVACSLVSGGDDVNSPRTSAKQDITAQQADFFEAKIRPVLEEHCFKCHGPRKQESGLRLDSRESVLRGNDNGPVVIAGHPEESPLIEAIGYGGPIKMPPKSKLNPQAIADITNWVRMGLPWPGNLRGSGKGPGQNHAAAGAKQHWAFQPVSDPSPPEVKAKAWPKTSIDRFILARLEARGLTPSAHADRRTLIRRVV